MTAAAPVVARFRSSKGQVIHLVREAAPLVCSCPGFTHRGSCQHVEAVVRWRALGQPVDPEQEYPPPVKWTRTTGTEP